MNACVPTVIWWCSRKSRYQYTKLLVLLHSAEEVFSHTITKEKDLELDSGDEFSQFTAAGMIVLTMLNAVIMVKMDVFR